MKCLIQEGQIHLENRCRGEYLIRKLGDGIMFWDDLDEDSVIEFKKEISKLIKKSHIDVSPHECIICGKNIKGTCNSHIVPQMVLKRIAEDGMILQANSVWDTKFLDKKKGISNSGVFHYICNDCDNTIFKDYEDICNIINIPSNKMLVEIALKNLLAIYSKRLFEINLFEKLLELSFPDNIYNVEIKRFIDTYNLDLRDYGYELNLCNNEIKNDCKNSLYDLFMWEKLPYRCPIAAQCVLALMKDMNGNIINNIYNYSDSYIIENMHLCVFPIERETIVMLFSLKENKRYRNFKYQIKHSMLDDKLNFVNWCIFKYCENYYISPQIQREVMDNKNLKNLSRENGLLPNFGVLDFDNLYEMSQLISVNEIPNILSNEYSI